MWERCEAAVCQLSAAKEMAVLLQTSDAKGERVAMVAVVPPAPVPTALS